MMSRPLTSWHIPAGDAAGVACELGSVGRLTFLPIRVAPQPGGSRGAQDSLWAQGALQE